MLLLEARQIFAELSTSNALDCFPFDRVIPDDSLISDYLSPHKRFHFVFSFRLRTYLHQH